MGEESNLGGYTNFIRTFGRGSVEGSIKVFLQRKNIRKLCRHVGFHEYLITEWLFPKKKKRGTARRKRKVRIYEQRFIKFIKDKYGSGLRGTRATQVIIDDFFIPDGVVPPVESEHTPICKYVISKNELPAFAGPFEGEEN